MSHGNKAARLLTPLIGLLLLAIVVSACCDGGSSAQISSPTPAASVAVLPGLTTADRRQDPAACRALQPRVLEVFVAPGTSLTERHAMAERVASMPEVVAYHYVTKREALSRARRMFERAGRSLPRMTVNPLPASFDILLRSTADVPIVAARFYDDPLVDNDPGAHNGVKARAGSVPPQASPSPSPSLESGVRGKAKSAGGPAVDGATNIWPSSNVTVVAHQGAVDGPIVARVVTDCGGRFSIGLPPGTYTLVQAEVAGRPETVTVHAGEYVLVTLWQAVP